MTTPISAEEAMELIRSALNADSTEDWYEFGKRVEAILWRYDQEDYDPKWDDIHHGEMIW
jgi:hypothetical protein